MDKVKMLKVEIEDLKTHLRHLMECEADPREILRINYQIDDLINRFYKLVHGSSLAQ